MQHLYKVLATLLILSLLGLCGVSLAVENSPVITPAVTEEELPEDESGQEKPRQRDEYSYTRSRTKPITKFERRIVEQGFRLLPYDHPFVIAYERTYNVEIDSYIAEVNGVPVSGVPFDFGGKGDYKGFNSRWWFRTGVQQYPVHGLDCAKFLSWIYLQMGIEVPTTSNALFFSGKTGVERKLPGIRSHLVLPSLEEAMIGDIAYNSEKQTYSSGHGSHVQMYLGTANILGISAELKKFYPDFPCDAHLVLDCGWSDGSYYYDLMRKLHVPSPRRGMAGTGVQFFTSIKAGSEYLYRSPKNVYAWKNPDTGHTFRIESRLEKNGRLLQYKPSSKIEFPINISRPIERTDI